MKVSVIKMVWIVFLSFFFFLWIELLAHPISFGLFSISVLVIYLSMSIRSLLLKRTVVFTSVFIISFVLINTFSLWGMLLAMIAFILIFQSEQGNRLFWLKEMYIQPIIGRQTYTNLKVIEPLEKHRSLIYKQELKKKIKQKPVYEWDDINLSTIGGDAIIDLGETVFPDKENIIIIQKVFGKTKLIIPKTIPIKLNVSMILGKISVDTDVFTMTSDNFRWESKEYKAYNRKVSINITSITGDVEVIRL